MANKNKLFLLIKIIISLSIIIIGIATCIGYFPILQSNAMEIIIFGIVLISVNALSFTYYQSGDNYKIMILNPVKLYIKWYDYLKAFVCWVNNYKRTYIIQPGLYYTGNDYDMESPMLVTSNYFLSVFLILRRIGKKNVRLLVIDTDGINVWCASGKGKFSSGNIISQLNKYDEKYIETKLKLILPKVSFSGVDIDILRKAGIIPIIGPIYAKDLPRYLDELPLKNRIQDRIIFGLKSRLFTWLPGFVQSMKYAILITILFWITGKLWNIPVPFIGVLGIVGIISTTYPILYPYLPGTRFAVKGLSLSLMIIIGLIVLYLFGYIPISGLIISFLFTFATGIFFGLLYTGNSAVSNYSRTQKETAIFMPIYIILYICSFITFIYYV